MSFFPDSTTFLAIGPLSIKYYALTMIGGAFIAYLFTKKDLLFDGYSNDNIDDIFVGSFLGGVIGARIWYVLFSYPAFYFKNPLSIFKIWEGGLAIQGGLFGAFIFGYFYCKKHNFNLFRVIDGALPNVLIAQAIGRWGNFINKEAFGMVVSESYFNLYPKFIKDGMFIDGSYRQPTFLWESLFNLVGFILIRYVFKKFNRNKRGDLSFIYFIWYGITRFIVEGFRTDSLMFNNIRMAQLISIVFIIIGFIGIFNGFNKIINKNDKPVILFDLDGTLLDTAPAIIASFTNMFMKYGDVKDFDEKRQKEVLGPPIDVMLHKFFPNEDTKKLVEEYRNDNVKTQAQYNKPMDNAKELLEYLKSNNYKIGIVSTKSHESVIYGLKLCEMDHYFDVVIGFDDVEKNKPNPEGIIKAVKLLNASKDSCIYIGDSATDIIAGKNAGVYTIGLIFDEARKKALEDTLPNKLIYNLGEVKNIIENKEANKAWTIDMM